MTALAANKVRRTRGVANTKKVSGVGADSSEFYEGAIGAYNNASKIARGADTANFRTAGVVTRRTTTGSSNTTEIELERGHEEWFPHDGNLGVTSLGKNACVLDDATLTNAATATNDVPVGEIIELETIGGVAGAWVAVGEYAPTNA